VEIRFTVFVFSIVLLACSPKIQPPDPDSLKPAWLKTTPNQDGYYVGIGQSAKDGSNNYIQAAKKSALDDLVSQIKVTVSSTSVLNQLEVDKKLSEQYEQIIKTTAADEIEEFELAGAWEDVTNYWVYYRLSISRYRQIKEEQKRDATLLATDYFKKGKQADQNNERLQAIQFYFQAFRSIEKYLGEPIRVTIDDKDLLLTNEIYASIQATLDKIKLQVTPSSIALNRRVNQQAQTVTAKAIYKDLNTPAIDLSLAAAFEKGAGDIFPTYKTNQKGEVKILINKISSKDVEQTVSVKVDIDALSGSSQSPIYTLISKTLIVPKAQIDLKVQRPIVYLTSDERSFGFTKSNSQITNKLKNLLANNGFEFTENKNLADLWFDVKANSEKGSLTGSIYATYLTCVIKVTTVRESKEIYSATLDRIKGYGLEYDKASVDSYNKALDTLEKERITELLNTVLQ
jgi:hypothetical protein